MLEKILMTLVVGLLKFVADRQAMTKGIKSEVYRDLAARAQKAYRYEIDAARLPDGGSELRVRDGADRIRVPDGLAKPGAGQSAGDHPVRPE